MLDYSCHSFSNGLLFLFRAVARPHPDSKQKEFFVCIIGISLLLDHATIAWFSSYKKRVQPELRTPKNVKLRFAATQKLSQSKTGNAKMEVHIFTKNKNATSGFYSVFVW